MDGCGSAVERRATLHVRAKSTLSTTKVCEVVLTNDQLHWTVQGRENGGKTLALKDVFAVSRGPVNSRRVVVHACVPTGDGSTRRKIREVTLICPTDTETDAWLNALQTELQTVCEEYQRPKRIFVILNPFSGKRRARAMFERYIRPMWTLAGIQITLVETRYSGHTEEVVSTLDLAQYDAVATVSGDGVVNEYVNGMLKRPDWEEAIRMPLGVIPGGTGNGLALSIGACDPTTAAFCVIQGTRSRLDIVSVFHKDNRKYSFLQLSWGMIADVDFDSEKYRWMGAFRDTVCGIGKVLKRKEYRMRLWYTPSQHARRMRCMHTKGCPACTSVDEEESTAKEASTTPLPPLPSPEAMAKAQESGPVPSMFTERSLDSFEWRCFEGVILLVTASNVYDIGGMHFPFAHLSDGCVDITFVTPRGLLQSIKLFDETPVREKHIEREQFMYHKVKGFVLEPLTPDGLMDIDGERLERSTIHAEVHRSLATVFSL